VTDTTRISITVNKNTLSQWDDHWENLDHIEDRSTFIRWCVAKELSSEGDGGDAQKPSSETSSNVDLTGLESDIVDLRQEIEDLTEKTRRQNVMEAAYPGREQAKRNIMRILPEAEDPIREGAEKYDDMDTWSYQHIDEDAVDGELMPFEWIHDTVFEDTPKQHALDIVDELEEEVDEVKSVARGQVDPEDNPTSKLYYIER